MMIANFRYGCLLWASRLFLFLNLAMVFSAIAYEFPSFNREPTGDLKYVEHFALAWCGGIQDGLAGPAKQVVQARTYYCSDRYGNYYFADMLNHQIWRMDTTGTMMVIAGTGEHGFQDGPAAQAKFFMSPVSGGYDAYNGIKCDDSCRIYVADNVNNRIRMIYQRPDGRWWVSTISGGTGSTRPAKGTWVYSSTLKYGCSPQFGLTPDGSAIYYAYYGGIYKVLINHNQPDSSKATRLITEEELSALGLSSGQWKSGSFATTDSVFYWSPDDPSCLMRYDEKTATASLWAGSRTHGIQVDSTGWRLDARFHTIEFINSPTCSTIFSGGSDQAGILRRIYQDTVKHLMPNGTYQIMNGKVDTYAGHPHCIDHKGRIFFTVGGNGMNADQGILQIKATFANSDTTNTWQSYQGTVGTSTTSVVRRMAPMLLDVSPNPFTGQALFTYRALHSDAASSLSLYNCRGELIRKFALKSESGSLAWDGKAATGEHSASGYYFAVLKNGQNRIVKRLMNIR